MTRSERKFVGLGVLIVLLLGVLAGCGQPSSDGPAVINNDGPLVTVYKAPT